jgi:hypothetical protein
MSISTSFPLAVDIGNGYLKFATGKLLGSIPSYIRMVNEDQELYKDPNSRIVKYQNGPNQHLLNRTWVIGKLAQALSGNGLYTLEKQQLAAQMVMGLIPIPPDIEEIKITRLVYSLPDNLNSKDVQAVQQALLGKHWISIDGKNVVVEIQKVDVVFEGLGAYIWAKHNNLLKLTDGYKTGVLDVGNKTVILTPFTGISHISERDKRAVDNIGVISLAEAISRDKIFRGPGVQSRVNVDLILRGISEGTFMYGTGSNGISFREVFPQYQEEWINNIRIFMRHIWGSMSTEIGEILAVGGGSHLLTPLQERIGADRFIICEDPTYANVKGMLLLGD